MKEDIVYGVMGYKPGLWNFVRVFMFEGIRHLGIEWTKDGCACIFHFLIKDVSDYDDFKNELMSVLKDCADIDSAYCELEAYLNSEYVGDFLEGYPEYQPEKRSDEEIYEYMDEAFNRVWLVRKQNMFCNMLNGEGIKLDIVKECNKAIDEVCKKYGIDFQEPVSDWDYGYWSGILAALRWVMGNEKDFLDT